MYKVNTMDYEYKLFHYFCTKELWEKKELQAVSII